MFISYRKLLSLNLFSVTNLQAEVELMYLLHMHRDYRRKNCQKMASCAGSDSIGVGKWMH